MSKDGNPFCSAHAINSWGPSRETRHVAVKQHPTTSNPAVLNVSAHNSRLIYQAKKPLLFQLVTEWQVGRVKFFRGVVCKFCSLNSDFAYSKDALKKCVSVFIYIFFKKALFNPLLFRGRRVKCRPNFWVTCYIVLAGHCQTNCKLPLVRNLSVHFSISKGRHQRAQTKIPLDAIGWA